ncbi:MAG: type II secretion system protein, partial [Labilithrix sp.]|nr:type II secretion system protein [Labilithrix sp.]
MRRFTAVELAVGVALLGSLAAVAVPAFVRELHASRFVEPTDGLARIGAAAVVYAEENRQFPESAPLTPATPPRGTKEADAPGLWDTPAWTALGFRPVPDGVPHAYAFSFENVGGGTAFVAQAHGDLDGDGIQSTFEIRGFARPGEKPAVAPG